MKPAGHLDWAPFGAAALVAVGAAALPHVAVAQEQPAALSPTISALIADIEAGRRDAVLQRIARIETLSGREKPVKTAAAFYDLFSGCKLLSRTARGSGTFVLEVTEWQCPAGVYRVSLIPERGENNPYVSVAEVMDPAQIAAQASAPPIAPPAPPVRVVRSLSPEERAAAEAAEVERRLRLADIRNAFGNAVKAGDLASVSEYMTPRTRFVFGTRNSVYSTDVIEMDDYGLAEGNRQIARAVELLGPIKGVECSREGDQYPLEICRWSFDQKDRTLFAMIHMQNEKLSVVQLYWATRDNQLEFQRAARERGNVGG